MPKTKAAGFSLVELLITLAILGVIATFTIPPLFQTPGSRATDRYTTMAKHAALMVVTAYEQYKAAHTSVPPGMKLYDLTPYMSYLKVDTSTSSYIDGPIAGGWSLGRVTCGTQFIGIHYCYPLHNGSVLWFDDAFYFGGTNSTNAIWFNFDPDGSGPAEALQLWMTYKGFIYTVKNLPTTMTSGYIFSTSTNAPATTDASWFTGF